MIMKRRKSSRWRSIDIRFFTRSIDLVDETNTLPNQTSNVATTSPSIVLVTLMTPTHRHRRLSLADKRGRSAIPGVDAVWDHGVVGPRIATAPIRRKTPTFMNAPPPHPHLDRLQRLIADLHIAVRDVVGDDVEWFEERYGIEEMFETIVAETDALSTKFVADDPETVSNDMAPGHYPLTVGKRSLSSASSLMTSLQRRLVIGSTSISYRSPSMVLIKRSRAMNRGAPPRRR